jgi:hypothetical protein
VRANLAGQERRGFRLRTFVKLNVGTDVWRVLPILEPVVLVTAI